MEETTSRDRRVMTGDGRSDWTRVSNVPRDVRASERPRRRRVRVEGIKEGGLVLEQVVEDGRDLGRLWVSLERRMSLAERRVAGLGIVAQELARSVLR